MFHESTMRYPIGTPFPMTPPFWFNRYPPAYPGSFPPPPPLPFGMNYFGTSGKMTEGQDKSQAVARDSEEVEVKTEEDANIVKLNGEEKEVCKEE